MDLFDVLSMGERVIVFSSVEDRCFYTWNQSATLQCWEQKFNTVRMFGMSKKRAKKIKKMVKRIAKDNKKRGK